MPLRDAHTVVPFPLARRLVVDTVRVGMRKHHVHGLLEIDVTDSRRRLRDHQASVGEKLSFTGYLIYCLAKAVGEHKEVQAIRNRRGDLVIFDDVDVTTMIEMELDGGKFALAHTLRSANRRTFRSLHDEIRAVQRHPKADIERSNPTLMRAFLRLPAFARDWFYAYMLSDPFLTKKMIGTVQVTSVGMFGAGAGWAIITPVYSLAVAVGGIATRLALVNG